MANAPVTLGLGLLWTGHLLGIAILVIEALYALSRSPSKMQTHLLMMTVAGLVSEVGYTLELAAADLSQTLTAIKVEYLGMPFMLLFALLFVSDCCRIKVPRWLSVGVGLVDLMIVASVQTLEHHHLFYQAYSFVVDGPFSYVVLERGPFFYLYAAIQLSEGLAVTLGVLFSWKRRKRLGVTDIQMVLLLCMVVFGVTGALVYLAGLTGGYDTTCIGMTIGTACLGVLFLRYRLYDTLILGQEQAMMDSDNGFILLNENGEQVYANKVAERLLNQPGLAGNHAQELQNLAAQGENLFYAGCVYTVKSRPITDRERKLGSTIEIVDITDAYRINLSLQDGMREQGRQIRSIRRRTMQSFANIVEARDGFTGAHVQDVSDHVNMVAEGLRHRGLYLDVLTDEYVDMMTSAAPLHDLGKIAVSETVLQKPGDLTEEEQAQMKVHTTMGASMIEDNLKEIESDEYVTVAREMALYHHERWDGEGYPEGLKGRDIPLCGRIMAVVDAYDAMVATRSYREAKSQAEAINELVQGSGTIFDPQIVGVFLQELEAAKDK